LSFRLFVEIHTLTRSPQEIYVAAIKKQLQSFANMRQQAANQMNMMQLNGNQQNQMQQGMMGSHSMQASMSNQGNQGNFNQGFPPQLQHQMQASPIPMNTQNQNAAPLNMDMSNTNANQAQPQGVQQMQQQQQQQQRPPNMGQGPQLGPVETARIMQIAGLLRDRASPEVREKAMANFNSLPADKQQQVRQRFGDPLVFHFRTAATQLFMNQRGASQNTQPGAMQSHDQGAPRPPQQLPNAQGAPSAMQGQDIDHLQLAGQQADAMRSANAGQLVVPASNNVNLNQQIGGLPMGLAQNGQIPQGTPGQGQMPNLLQQQQHRQQQMFLNAQANAQRQGLNPQEQAQAQAHARQMQARVAQAQVAAQAQAQLQAQAQARQRQVQHAQQAQNQQAQTNTQQMNLQRQMGGQVQQSPMPLLTQPVNQPGQQPGGTPQQRPQGMLLNQQQSQMNSHNLQAFQAQAQAQAQNRANVLRQLPADLPAGLPQNLRNQLQIMSDEQYKVAIERIRSSQPNGQPQAQNGPTPLGQAGNQFMPMGNQQQAQPLNPQNMNAQQLQQAQLQRMQQMQFNMQQNQRNLTQQQGLMSMPPEAMADMDQKPFPPSILRENGINAPESTKTWIQLKEWITRNPQSSPNVNVQGLMRLQTVKWAREQMQARQAGQPQQNANPQQFGGQPGGLLAMSQAGPAPTAPMVAGGINAAQQQQPRMGMNGMMMPGMQGQQYTPLSAQDLQAVRIKMNIPPTISDEQLRQKMHQQRLQLWQRQAQANPGQMQARVLQQQQQLGQQQLVNQQQRMPGQMLGQQPQRPQSQQQQRQPQPGPTQTPIMGQMNGQMGNRPPQRPPQATPQPPMGKNNLKRPAPEDVIEISDSNQSPPQSVPMQISRSQQQRPQNMGNQQNQQKPQPVQPIQGSDQTANRSPIDKRLHELNSEVSQANPRQPPVLISPGDRQQMINALREHAQYIGRIDNCIRMYFSLSRDENNTRQYLKQRLLLTHNVNTKDPNLTLVDHPSIDLRTMQQYLASFKAMVGGVMQKAKERQLLQQSQQSQQGQMPQPPQAGFQQKIGQPGVPDASQAFGAQHVLNATNLEQQQQALRQQQLLQNQQQLPNGAQHARRPSKQQAQAPPAPTAGPGQMPFPFAGNAASPQGVPKYGDGAGNLTADNLKLQPRKKQKPNTRQPPSTASTPAQPTPAPSTISPQVGKMASPDFKRQSLPGALKQEVPMPALPFKCPDNTCPYSEKGFETREQLAQHKSNAHSLMDIPSTEDPLEYATKNFAAALGLNKDGTPKEHPSAKTASKVGKAPVLSGKASQTPGLKQESTSPAGAVTTPMARVPTQPKESPALDRLKTPQHAGRSAPTSAAPSTTEKGAAAKSEKTTEPPTVSSAEDVINGDLDFDPWKDSTIQLPELYDIFHLHDTFTGDWGYDRALEKVDSPATTPDTNISKDTTSTQETDISENDKLNITLGVERLPSDEKLIWGNVDDNWSSIMDASLANDIGALGVDEGTILRLDDGTDLMDWDAMFGPSSTLEGNKVPGWEFDGEVPVF
jgi:hypothetical protein